MSKKYTKITQAHKKFIERQKIFFTGSADADGRVNISPKGSDTLRVMDPHRVVWLNLTGSGNETTAHLISKNRITLMFCSFTEKPMILRLYGSGDIIRPDDPLWDSFAPLFSEKPGARQIFDIKIDLVQSSCGFQVPFFEYQGERELLYKWAKGKGDKGIKQYWQDKNTVSLDGKPIPL